MMIDNLQNIRIPRPGNTLLQLVMIHQDNLVPRPLEERTPGHNPHERLSVENRQPPQARCRENRFRPPEILGNLEPLGTGFQNPVDRRTEPQKTNRFSGIHIRKVNRPPVTAEIQLSRLLFRGPGEYNRREIV